MTKVEKLKSKRYHLDDSEIKNVKFRRMAMDLVANALNQDMGAFIYSNVLPRLGLKDVKVQLSEDGEWVEVEEESIIIKP